MVSRRPRSRGTSHGLCHRLPRPPCCGPRASGRPLLDLTETNPTQLGLRWDADELASFLGQRDVARYDPSRARVATFIASSLDGGVTWSPQTYANVPNSALDVVTGDNGLTAAAIARRVGIGAGGMQVVSGAELDKMSERDLDALLTSGDEVVFARSSPEAKLRIADALRALGQVVAMGSSRQASSWPGSSSRFGMPAGIPEPAPGPAAR